MRHLCDSNVFIALSVREHPAHETTRKWLQTLVVGDVIGFCRVTEMSFVRLLTQKIATGFSPATNAEAVELLDAWERLDFIEVFAEPEGTHREWLRLGGVRQVAPKRWMDAYLAAFAISGEMRLVTLDRDFQQFAPRGLDLLVL